MYTQVTFGDFCDAFNSMGRQHQFSYYGKRALFDYLEDYEESTGEQVELDVIALCCEFTEYADWEEFTHDYDGYADLDELRDHTTVIELDNDDGFIIQDF